MGADASSLCCTHFWPLFVSGLCGHYPTVRLAAALMLRAWWMVPFLSLSSFILLVTVAATITNAGRSRGPYLPACWHTENRYLQQGHHNNLICLRSFFTRRSHLATSSHTHPFCCPPYRQHATTCLPVRKPATRGRLRSSTRQYLDSHETGRARSRSRDSRRGDNRRQVPVTKQKTGHNNTTRTHQPRGSTRRFAQRRRRTNLHRTWRRLDASSHQPRGRATSCRPPPSVEHHPQNSRDRGAHAGPFDLAYAAARAQTGARQSRPYDSPA